MKQARLFWKILFSFWLTFICISEGVWLIFYFYELPRIQTKAAHYVYNMAKSRLGSAQTALRLGGEKGLQTLLASWPEEEQLQLSITPLSDLNVLSSKSSEQIPADENISDDYPIYLKSISLNNGSRFVLRYDGSRLLPRKHRSGVLNMPPELIVLAIIGGLLFSALLAWYLTAPVWKLRMGFFQLARGGLDVRIKGLMGRRRDEIADLARDFDLMAERMQVLVKSRKQLLYDVSHELRSPLARLHMAIGLARQNPQRTEHFLDRIEQESVRMDELVGELLMLSRVESGGSNFEEYFDLSGLVCVVVGNARFEAQADGINITLDMPLSAKGDEEPEIKEGFTVRGDAELMRRALENVVRNGLRHSPQRKHIGGCGLQKSTKAILYH